jgi:iron complex outermembrane receptor protein
VNRIALFSSAGIFALAATTAFAQDAAQPAPAAEPSPPASGAATPQALPDVTVVVKEKHEAPKKKVARKKTNSKKASGAAVASSAQPTGEPSFAEAQSNVDQPETALGPVKGLVATRTATGSKTDTPIIEIPRTVNVVTQDQITEQQPQSIRQALGYTPGVQTQTGASSILDTISVRGFTAPIFLDGLLLANDNGISFARLRLEPYGLQRLEVLKGPASGLFGYAPPGGLINAISKRPQDTPQGEAFVQFGNKDHREAGFDITGPLDPSEALTYRLVGLVRDSDFDFDFADKQRYYIAPSFTIRPDRDTSLTILGSAQRDTGFGPFQFVPLELTQKSAPFGRISRNTYLGEPDIDDYHQDQWTIGYEFEHRFNNVFQFRQNLRYARSDQYISAMRAAGVQADMETITRSANGVVANVAGLTLDNQLQADFGTGPLQHKVLAGVDYQHIDSSSNFFVNFGASPINAYHPVYGTNTALPFDGTPFVMSDATLDQTGVYLQDQIKFGRWIATLGGRHDWADTSLYNKLVAPADADQEINDQKWTGSAGLSYLFDNGLAPYFNYSTSYLPASGTSLINSAGGPLQPTTGEGYEAGVKYEPPGMNALLTASAFQITQQNVNSFDIQSGQTVQTGEVRVRGVELEGKASLTDNFDVLASYTYLQPIITADIISSFDTRSNVGHDYQQVSRQLASAWGMYTWHEGALRGLGLGAGVRYVGSQYTAADNADKIPGFTLVDAALTYDLKYIAPTWDGAKLQLNALNLFDKYYVSTCQGSDFCQLGESRTFLATIKYDW